MADVRSILGISRDASQSGKGQQESSLHEGGTDTSSGRGPFHLRVGEQVSSLVYTTPFKRKASKRKIPPGKRWLWKAYKNSARPDGVQLHHWTRTDVDTQTVDYPYSRFNVRVSLPWGTSGSSVAAGSAGGGSGSVDGTGDGKRYTQQEYDAYLTDSDWSKAETDYLFDLVERYDMRWPVVADRFDFGSTDAGREERRLRREKRRTLRTEVPAAALPASTSTAATDRPLATGAAAGSSSTSSIPSAPAPAPAPTAVSDSTAAATAAGPTPPAEGLVVAVNDDVAAATAAPPSAAGADAPGAESLSDPHRDESLGSDDSDSDDSDDCDGSDSDTSSKSRDGRSSREEEDLKRRVFDVLVRLNQARRPGAGAKATEHLLYDYDYAVRRRQLLDQALSRTEADQEEEKRLEKELAAVNKELQAVQKTVKARYGLDEGDHFRADNEIEVSAVARLPGYMYVRVCACARACVCLRA
jgi:hypothetical protein